DGTTLVSVVTDIGLDRPRLFRAAKIAAGGLARSIIPVATATDGDVLFVSTTGEGRRPPPEQYPGAWADQAGWAAAEAIMRAVVRAVAAPPG
ncbi:MAG TPA: P1 family peptidase, partial [Thermoplasmata archaeon]|nr:P1 family peptidase [Thermoplasmata archaeon]